MSADLSFKPDPALLEGAKFHDNVTQVYIRTTEDKLRNFLRDFKEAYAKLLSWTVPLSLVLSLGATLLTSSFLDRYGRPASFWEAIFTILFWFSVAWTLFSAGRAVSCWKAASIERLIKKIKNEA
jgi:hypothetical protein